MVNEMKCPKCKGLQYCSCSSCCSQHKQKITWKHINSYVIACGHCGLKMGADEWQNESWKQYKESINVSS